MERYKDLNIQLKLVKVFKAVISAGLVAPVFVSVSACEKAKPVVEEAQATETIPITEVETTSPQTTPETTAEVKKFQGLNIELITDPSFPKATFERQGQTFTPKEVVYKDETGSKKMEEALMITWALALKEQAQHPAFANVDSKDGEALLSTLKGLLDKGEKPTFKLYLKDDWSVGASNTKPKPYEVDMTKGVKIVFVGEVTNIVTYENFHNPNFEVPKDYFDSKDFFWIQFQDNYIISAIRLEVDGNGALTIKPFSKMPLEESFCSILGAALQAIVNQKFSVSDYGENKENPGQPNYKPRRLIYDALYDGAQWDENDKWLEYGNPIIVRTY